MKQATNLTKKKICTSCKNELPITDFCRKTENPDGRNYICKKCQTEYNKSKYVPVKDKWAYVF